jgi:hypothetical protein
MIGSVTANRLGDARVGWAARARDPLLAIAVAYVAVRVLAFTGVDAREFQDTIDYRDVAAAPLWSAGFLAGKHPPTLPLLYKILGSGDLCLDGQVAISTACWLALATATASAIRHPRVRLAAFAAILCFSLSRDVVMWDSILLSESISLSLTAASVAAWLLVVRRPGPVPLALALGATTLWTLARDPHAYVALLAAAALALSLVMGGHRRLRAIAALGLVAMATASLWSASVGFKRWQYPLQNLVTLRVAADPAGLDYFKRAGMPVTPRFVELSRQYRETGLDPFHYPAAYGDPSLRSQFLPFQIWLMREGRHVYTTYLLTHPGAVAAAFGELDHVLLAPRVDYYQSSRPPRAFPLPANVFFPRAPVLPLVYLAVVVLMAVAVTTRAGPRREWAVPIFLVASSLPFAVLVWHAEVLEADRHGLICTIFLRLGTLILGLMLADELVRGRSSRTAPA